MKNKEGFTLVELLAVIVILAIILVIAVPKVMDIINDAKKGTLESTAKMIASQAEKQKVQNTVLGKDKEVTCDSVAKINDVDYESCEIIFDDSGEAKVTILGSGKFEGLSVCKGTKTNATAIEADECILVCKENEVIVKTANAIKPYEVKNYDSCVSFLSEVYADDGAPQEFIDDFVPSVCNGDGYEGGTTQDILNCDVEDGFYTEVELIENKVIKGNITETCVPSNGVSRIEYEYNTSANNNGLIKDDTEDENIRYAGSNPKNYILFNDEIWRIVGVFNVKTNASDTDGVPRIKIVRDELLSDRAFDEAGSRVWEDSDLELYLNGTTEGNYYYGLSATAKGQISQAVWSTGPVYFDSNGTSLETAYSDEKNSAEILERIVGLISVADYGYAGGNSCTYVDNDSCGTNNWLNNGTDYWLIQKYSYNERIVCIANSEGSVEGLLSTYEIGSLPSVYLNPDIKLTGTGENTPEGIYRIS